MKRLKRGTAAALAAVLLLTGCLPALTVSADAAVTQGDIQAIRDQLSGLSGRKEETEAQLAAVRGDMDRAREQVELIQEQVLLCEQEIGVSRELLAQYDLQIEEKRREIQSLEEQLEEQYQEFYQQVRWMEETGSASYLSILFEVNSFAEMLDYAMLMTDIMEYSDRIVQRLEATQAELAAAREALQSDRNDQAEVQKELEDRLAELEQKRSEAQALLSQIAASESEFAQQAAQLAADEAEVQRALKDAEAQYAAQIAAASVASGEWYWPVPGYYSITSFFGGRNHPITGQWESHTGTDIGVPRGVEIHAAQAGVVTTAQYNASYGNYCIISHGNGYATLYAHMLSLPRVSVGETVAKGQVIGNVGMTGSANGYHLHFELRVNGVRDNVLKLYPNLNFIDNT